MSKPLTSFTGDTPIYQPESPDTEIRELGHAQLRREAVKVPKVGSSPLAVLGVRVDDGRRSPGPGGQQRICQPFESLGDSLYLASGTRASGLGGRSLQTPAAIVPSRTRAPSTVCAGSPCERAPVVGQDRGDRGVDLSRRPAPYDARGCGLPARRSCPPHTPRRAR